MDTVEARSIVKPISLARGTLVTTDLARARRMFEELLGLQCVRHAPGRMLVRDRGADGTGRKPEEYHFVLDVREVPAVANPQRVLHHWGMDFTTKAGIDAIHKRLVANREAYGLQAIHEPQFQHGSYAFYFQDADSNWWEFQFKPPSRDFEKMKARGDVIAD